MALGRLLEFLGLALTLGGPLFLLAVWRPTAGGGGREAGGAAVPDLAAAAEAGVARSAAGGCLLLALGSVADLVAVVAGATGVPPGRALSASVLPPFLATTRYGHVWAALAHAGALARPDTPYGLALAAKHALFAAMLAAAAGNRLLGLRRAGAPAARGGGAAAAGREARRLRAGVRAEAGLGLAALAAAALLGTLPPPGPR